MVRRSKKDDDYIGPSRGWVGLFHKFMMLLLFPLRKPLWFLLIVAVLFLAPTFRGVRPAEVHLWYGRHIAGLTSRVSELFGGKAREVVPGLKEISQAVETTVAEGVNSFSETAVSEPAAPQLVPQPPRKVRRQVFERAEDAPAKASVPAAEPAPRTETIRRPHPATKSVAAKPRQLPNLRYLSAPETVSGVPVVINANELRVAGQMMFLYGIFVQPASQKGLDGALYLRRLLEDKTVECEINAYTYQNIATAICTLDGVNLNRRMVERGYSQNVALD